MNFVDSISNGKFCQFGLCKNLIIRARTSFDNGENLFEPKKGDDEDDLDAALISPMVGVFLIIVFFFLD